MKALAVQHLAALQIALRRLRASPLGTLLSLLVIALALALPCAGWLALNNLKDIAGDTSGAQEISLFMDIAAGKKEAGEIEARLKEGNYGHWRFVPREEALKSLQAKDGMTDIMAGLSGNPLPDAYIIEPVNTDPAALEQLAKTFASWPDVAHVQLDSAWAKRLDAFVHIGRVSITLLAVLFATTLIVVTFNTIRLQILAQAAEIEVARLIGATDAFIHRPFQYYGAAQGALGGLLAALLVSGGGYLLSTSVEALLSLYGSSFTPYGLSWQHVVLLVVTGGVLGWIGAQCSVMIHLFRAR